MIFRKERHILNIKKNKCSKNIYNNRGFWYNNCIRKKTTNETMILLFGVILNYFGKIFDRSKSI